MTSSDNRDLPQTVGQLRRHLSELGHDWKVDPRINDDDPLPDPPRGAQPEEEIPEEARLTPLEPDADLDAVITAEPPANPLLADRWKEAGLLKRERAQEGPSVPEQRIGDAG